MTHRASYVGVHTIPQGTKGYGRQRNCARCGIKMARNTGAATPVCKDCRSSDPKYIRLIAASRRDSTA